MSAGDSPTDPDTADDRAQTPAQPSTPTAPLRHRLSGALCCVVVLLALLSTFRVMIGEDPREVAPLPTRMAIAPAEGDRSGATLLYALDQRFVIWVIARNARTWLRAPQQLYDAELCHPEPQSLALSEPVYTLGLLSTPIWAISGDPLVTYNALLFMLPLLSALVMFGLVRSWTGGWTAALVAALLYAFHIMKIGDTVHLYYTDTVWLLVALYSFTRWLERGGWSPLLGLTAACALQIGGGLYALLGAGIFALPYAAFAIHRHGLRRTRPIEWSVLIGATLLVCVLAFAPYLDKSATGELATRPIRMHLPWTSLLPWAEGSPGWLLTALALFAFIPIERLRGDANTPDVRRWWVLASVALVLVFATGGNAGDRLAAMLTGTTPPFALPNPYDWLAAAVPVLGTVRAPLWIASTAYLGLALLAGLGVARLLAACPQRLVPAAAVLLVGAALWSLQPPAGLFKAQLQRPDAAELAFFAALEARGNSGPILELPTRKLGLERGTKSLTLAAYHHRPTSRCYSSFIPSSVKQAWDQGEALPAPHAIRAIGDMGFTTLVLRHPPLAREAGALRERLDDIAEPPGPPLDKVHSDGLRSAWVIVGE